MEQNNINSEFTETITIDFPIEVKYITDARGVSSIYIPLIDTYSYVKDINNVEDVKHQINALMCIWMKFNLDHHMHNKPYNSEEKK
jgi:uncharacterized protein YqiB (DUF1249 family)